MVNRDCVKLGCAYPLAKGKDSRQSAAEFKGMLQSIIGAGNMGIIRDVKITTPEQRRQRKSRAPSRGLVQKIIGAIGWGERLPKTIRDLVEKGYEISVETRTHGTTGRHKAYFAPEVVSKFNKGCSSLGGYPLVEGMPIMPEDVRDWSVCPFKVERISNEAIEIQQKGSAPAQIAPSVAPRQVQLAPTTPTVTGSARERIAQLAFEKFSDFKSESPKCVESLKDAKFNLGIGNQSGAVNIAGSAVDEDGMSCNMPKPLSGRSENAMAELLAFNNLATMYGEGL